MATTPSSPSPMSQPVFPPPTAAQQRVLDRIALQRERLRARRAARAQPLALAQRSPGGCGYGGGGLGGRAAPPDSLGGCAAAHVDAAAALGRCCTHLRKAACLSQTQRAADHSGSLCFRFSGATWTQPMALMAFAAFTTKAGPS